MTWPPLLEWGISYSSSVVINLLGNHKHWFAVFRPSARKENSAHLSFQQPVKELNTRTQSNAQIQKSASHGIYCGRYKSNHICICNIKIIAC